MALHSIEKNIEQVRLKMAQACARSHRDLAQVTLVAVSKTKPTAEIRQAISEGLKNFGENYAQELSEKAEQLKNSEVHWHFIGPLQTNKVRQVVGVAQWIHSVDRENLAREIERVAERKQDAQQVLMQVNVAQEDTKSGVSLESALDLARLISSLKYVRLVGLMALPPAGLAEDSRKHFKKLKNLFEELKKELNLGEEFAHLSMGTTQDYEIAIEEGATFIRVGTEIFGERAVKENV